jgi:hypothetical protein
MLTMVLNLELTAYLKCQNNGAHCVLDMLTMVLIAYLKCQNDGAHCVLADSNLFHLL